MAEEPLLAPLLALPASVPADRKAALVAEGEAILRADILPEEVALKYGYPADQRVMNLVLRPRFRAIIAEGGYKTSTEFEGGDTADIHANLFTVFDGKRLLVANANRNTVTIIDPESGRVLETLSGAMTPDAPPGNTPNSLALSPDGGRLAVTRPEGGVTFHRLPGGQNDGEWSAPEWVTTVAFSPDGARLAVGGGKEAKDNVLAVIDTATMMLKMAQAKV